MLIRLMMLASGLPPDFWDAEDLASEIGDPCVWTDGSREVFIPLGAFLVAGAGVLAMQVATWLLADLGGRHHPGAVVDIRRALVDTTELWYTNVLQLHRFKIDTSPVSVNLDGRGSAAPDPLVWDQGKVECFQVRQACWVGVDRC